MATYWLPFSKIVWRLEGRYVGTVVLFWGVIYVDHYVCLLDQILLQCVLQKIEQSIPFNGDTMFFFCRRGENLHKMPGCYRMQNACNLIDLYSQNSPGVLLCC